MSRDDAIRMALDALECMSSWAQKVCLKPCFVPCDCLDRGKSYLPETEAAISALRAALAEPNEYTVKSNGKKSAVLTAMMNSRTKREAALAEADEPVAWRWGYRSITTGQVEWMGVRTNNPKHDPDVVCEPLYTNPPRREPLTPVAWMKIEDPWGGNEAHFSRDEQVGWTALYTRPPRREPLTEEELFDIYDEGGWQVAIGDFRHIAHAIERAHGIGGDE